MTALVHRGHQPEATTVPYYEFEVEASTKGTKENRSKNCRITEIFNKIFDSMSPSTTIVVAYLSSR
jgi:hypothetical protein